MSDEDKHGAGKLGFLDSLARLFHAKEAEQTPQPSAPSRFEKLEAEFEAAIRGLNQRVEQHQHRTQSTEAGSTGLRQTAEERAAERLHRTDAAHRAIRDDIEKMHAQLGTKLTSESLEAIAADLKDLESVSSTGKNSHALLPRARYAIAEQLRVEAGELAVARLVALLERAKLGWPDATQYSPSATPEEVERSRRRRLADVRESFLAHGFERTAERSFGIVRGWGGDYPDRRSSLWEETVLEGVAAGIRGQLLKDFVELLRQDRELILTQTEASIGKELAALQKVLESGVHSMEQANAVVASSLRALDEVVPGIAWEHLRSRLPRARGEFSE